MPANYVYTPYVWPMLVSALFSAAVAAYAWRHRAVPGTTAFALYNLFLSLWAIFTAIEMAATWPTKTLYHRLEAAAALAALSALLYFALEHASLRKWATHRTALLISLVSGGILILMATNDFHHLLWARFWFDGYTRVQRGPLGPLLMLWSLLLPTLALVVFLRLLLRSRGIYRRQALILFIGSLLPLLTYLGEPAGINPIAPLDPVIIVQNVSSLLYFLAIFRFGMLEVAPIGRDTAFEVMTNGVLVVDSENRIVDLNPAAGEVLGLSREATVGHPAGQALAAYPELSRLLEQEPTASTEITLNGTSQPRIFQAQASPLTHPRGFHLGQLILLQDVTEQRRAQAQLLEQQWAQATLEERELLANELHDGLAQNLAFLNVQAQAAQIHLQAGQNEAVQASVVRLAEAARELQGDTRELIGQLLTVSLPSEGFCTTLRQAVDRFEKQNGLPVRLDIVQDADKACDPSVLPPATGVQLLRIVQEALANVRKHAGSPTQISVDLRAADGQLQLIVADNGNGFDPAVNGPNGERFGLQVMRQRAERIGGQVSVHSAPGQGTRVEVSVPLVAASVTA
jgi:PAS domain S-box-containing protein